MGKRAAKPPGSRGARGVCRAMSLYECVALRTPFQDERKEEMKRETAGERARRKR